MMVAGLFGLVALLLLCQAAVFALVNAGFTAPVAVPDRRGRGHPRWR